MGDMKVSPRAARIAAGVCGLLLTAVAAVWAQTPTVDQLLTRLFSTEGEDPYELTADFTGRLTFVVRGSRITAVAVGSFQESRRPGDIRRRKVIIERLDVPLLLRPFTGTLKRIIEEKVEAQSESQETFHAHDIFLAQELSARRYLLVGVHRDIVDEALNRYGKPQDKSDIAIRRRIAHWLFTSPTMREFLVRPGPPYAMRAVLDDEGHIYELTLLYDWGQVGTRIVYIEINSVPVWRNVVSDANSELSGLGRVEGELVLVFTNHCLNCRPTKR